MQGRWWAAGVAAAALGLALLWAPAACAQPAPAPTPAGARPGALDDLPPDVRERLTPEQIHELLMAREEQRDPPAVAIVVPVSCFLVTFAIVAAALYASYRKDRQRHETLRRAIERGAEIPPSLLIPPRPPHSDLRRGVLLLSVGVALAILLIATSPAPGIWTAALIPVSLGLGYLVVHRLERRSATAPAEVPGGSVRTADG